MQETFWLIGRFVLLATFYLLNLTLSFFGVRYSADIQDFFYLALFLQSEIFLAIIYNIF